MKSIITPAEAAAELLRRDDVITNLRAFTKEFWPYVVPSPFQDSWVIGAVCEHLQALFENQIRRLLINIYMRSAKSTVASVMYPAWVWGREPSERFLYVASTQSLALRDADFTRDVIKTLRYQALYSGSFALTKDASGMYRNDKLGSRQSLGAESQVTGFGANNKFFDDPNDANQVESPVQREATNGRFSNLSTRSDSFENDRFCVIQQRTHPKDVSGYIDELGLNFEKLIIPLEYQGAKYVTSIGWSDPRTTVGEVADPARFPPEAIVELKNILGYRYEGQANQRPKIISEGAAYREFNRTDHIRECEFDPFSPLFVSLDFNRHNHNWGLYQFGQLENGEDGYRAFDEIYMQDGTVEDMCRKLDDKIAEHNVTGEIWFFGDQSGEALRAEATESSWQQVKAHYADRRPKPVYRYMPQGPIAVRVENVNMHLRSADGKIRTEVNPRCLNLIRDFEEVTMDLLYSSKKTALLSHASDNFGYMICQHIGVVKLNQATARIKARYGSNTGANRRF